MRGSEGGLRGFLLLKWKGVGFFVVFFFFSKSPDFSLPPSAGSSARPCLPGAAG